MLSVGKLVRAIRHSTRSQGSGRGTWRQTCERTCPGAAFGKPAAHEATMDPDLMVIVPRDLPSRAAVLNEALAGTAIRVLVDRRHGDRRRARQGAAGERR